jgi:hypothetical protein
MAPTPLSSLIRLLARDDHDGETKTPDHKSGPSGWAIFFIILLVLALLLLTAFVIWKFVLKRPLPSLGRRRDGFSTSGGSSSGGGLAGAKNWFNNIAYKIKNPRARSTTAGFEPSGISAGRAAGGTGRNPLDPDEAWDARVGHEAEYNPFYGEGEETELRDQRYAGGAGPPGDTGYTGYAGASYASVSYPSQPSGPERGRSRSPAPGAMPRENPFGDDAASSLRTVSPRPAINTNLSNHKRTESTQSSPRRSVFRESL